MRVERLFIVLGLACGGRRGLRPVPARTSSKRTAVREIVDAQPFDISVDGAAPRPGTVKMAVPAYFDPPSPEWQRLIAGAPAVGMIVFNPESGPGTAADPAYTQVIAQAQAAGIVMVGYVATSYGARPEADVIADINRYYDFYTLSGIYFAEGPMDADCTAMEPMYHRMADAVRARDAQSLSRGRDPLLSDVHHLLRHDGAVRAQLARVPDRLRAAVVDAGQLAAAVRSLRAQRAARRRQRGAVAGGRERRRLGVHHRPEQSEPVERVAELLQRGAGDDAQRAVSDTKR